MDNDSRRWMPAFLAGAVLAATVGLSALGGNSASTSSASDVSSASSADGPVTSVADPVPPPTIKVKTKLKRTISKGMSGDDVKMVQKRLKALHFDPGDVDGIYGGQTIRSVWAFQKLVLKVKRDKVKDRLTPEMWSRMQDNLVFKPRRPSLGDTPTHAEAYLDKQVLILFRNDKPLLITHISSGSEKKWCEVVEIDPGEQGNRDGTVPLQKGVCGYSWTTPGIFTFDRKYTKGDGWRKGGLGRMYRPTYFNKGLAVHGSGNVPDYPDSHGCIRIPMHTADFFQKTIAVGDKLAVFDGKKEPEDYGTPEPYWDRPDPSWQPTTTVPSSTVPSSKSSPPTSKGAKPVPTTKPKPKPTKPPKSTTTTKPKPKPTKPPKSTTTTRPKPPPTTDWVLPP